MNKIKEIRFRVTGVSHYEKDIIEKLGKYNSVYDSKASELKELYPFGETIYEYNFMDLNPELIPEPDNEYDPNAVMVVVNNVKVGYIKKGSCSRANNLLNSPDFVDVRVDIHGGKYKRVYCYTDDDGKDKIDVDRGDGPLHVDIDILVNEEVPDDAPAALEKINSSVSAPVEVRRPVLSKPVKLFVLFAVIVLICIYIVTRI